MIRKINIILCFKPRKVTFYNLNIGINLTNMIQNIIINERERLKITHALNFSRSSAGLTLLHRKFLQFCHLYVIPGLP